MPFYFPSGCCPCQIDIVLSSSCFIDLCPVPSDDVSPSRHSLCIVLIRKHGQAHKDSAVSIATVKEQVFAVCPSATDNCHFLFTQQRNMEACSEVNRNISYWFLFLCIIFCVCSDWQDQLGRLIQYCNKKYMWWWWH